MIKNKEDFKFIRGFSKITLTNIANKLNISRQAISSGETTDENLRKVRKEIEKEIAKLYLDVGDEDVEKADSL